MSNEIEKSEKLKHDVQALYDMELNNYLMTRAIAALDHRISKLGIQKQFPKPKPAQVIDDDGQISFRYGCTGFVIGALICFFLIGLPITLSTYHLSWIFVSLIVGGFIGAFVGLHLSKKRITKEQGVVNEQYEKYMLTYNGQIEDDKRRVAHENKIKEILIQQRNHLLMKRQESIGLLETMYNQFGIDKDFRTLVAIGYMYEYLRLGISNQLQGINGLYYLIQQRLQWDIIRATLEDISTKLDTIINKQDRIYYELCSINEKCDRMINLTVQSINTNLKNGQKLDAINENTATTAYTVERARFEDEYRHMTGL